MSRDMPRLRALEKRRGRRHRFLVWLRKPRRITDVCMEVVLVVVILLAAWLVLGCV